MSFLYPIQTAPILPKVRTNGNRLRTSIDSLPTLCYPHCTGAQTGRLTTLRDSTQNPMTICRPFTLPSSILFKSWNGRALGLLLCAALLLWAPPAVSAKVKPHQAPRSEPELRILELKVSPNPYTVSSGPLQFSALVQLPKELNGATLLEVSSFITSPSKNSLRFLTTRTPLGPHAASTTGAAPPHISVVLTWDGLDQQKATAPAGLYHFEVRAKLLANGEKGPRTQTVGWPKRGTIEVK